MSQLVFFNWGLQMRVKGLHKSVSNISLVGTSFGGGCVLLAGEMLICF